MRPTPKEFFTLDYLRSRRDDRPPPTLFHWTRTVETARKILSDGYIAGYPTVHLTENPALIEAGSIGWLIDTAAVLRLGFHLYPTQSRNWPHEAEWTVGDANSERLGHGAGGADDPGHDSSIWSSSKVRLPLGAVARKMLVREHVVSRHPELMDEFRRNSQFAEPVVFEWDEWWESHPLPVARNPSAVTSSPAFRRWFGDSKIVDKHGRPLVVYHGSKSRDVRVFRPRTGVKTGSGQAILGEGVYFSTRLEEAQRYASEHSSGEPVLHGGTVYSVYIRMEHPFVRGESRFGNAARHIAVDFMSRTYGADYAKHKWAEISRKPTSLGSDVWPPALLTQMLQADGYDGVIDGHIICVFDSKQIKSAMDNDGSFDPDDPDMRSNPLLAKPPGRFHRLQDTRRYRKLIGHAPRDEDYDGVHTSTSELIAAAYAMGSWSQLADRTAAYPVLVTLDVSGLKPLPDVDATLRGAEAADDLSPTYRKYVKEDGWTLDDFIEDDDYREAEVGVGETPAAFIFEDTGHHVAQAIRDYAEDEEENEDQVFDAFIKSGKLPAGVLTRMVQQQRYLNDFDLDRVVRIDAIRPWWHQVLLGGDDERDEEIAKLEARGFYVFDAGDWPFHHPGETRTLWEAPDAAKRTDTEYHGTTSAVIALAFPGLIPKKTPFPVKE